MTSTRFLHTLASNVDAFTPLVAERRPDLRIRHAVADHLLNEARKTGMTPEIAREVQSLMTDLTSTGARVVVCTCSTIGGAAEATDTGGRFVAMRIDRPMADRAVTLGPDLLVLAALPSTFGPTRALLEDSAQRAKVRLRLEERLVEGAWVHFERGDRDAYYRDHRGRTDDGPHGIQRRGVGPGLDGAGGRSVPEPDRAHPVQPADGSRGGAGAVTRRGPEGPDFVR